MSAIWEDWASKKAEIGPRDAIEGLMKIGLAFRAASQDVKIPLQTRLRQLPEIIQMVRLAESGAPEGEIAPLLNSAPKDLRAAILNLRSTLGVVDAIPDAPQADQAGHPGPLGYYINLDERGTFFADVRDEDGHSIFEIRSEDETGDIWLIEDGFMENKWDTVGLQAHLQEIGLIEREAAVLPSFAFERITDSLPSMEM